MFLWILFSLVSLLLCFFFFGMISKAWVAQQGVLGANQPMHSAWEISDALVMPTCTATITTY